MSSPPTPPARHGRGLRDRARSFLLNYLAQMWEIASKFSFLGLLQYDRPLFILRNGAWPLRDLTILLCLAAVLWTTAAIVFARRDLSTT